MLTKTTLPFLLFLTLWTHPLQAAEPTRMIPLLQVGGVVLEVPSPKGYTRLAENSDEFVTTAEVMQKTAGLRVVGLFTEMGVAPLQKKYVVVCSQEKMKMTPLGFEAAKGVVRNMDWGLEARKQAEKHPHIDPAQTGVLADSACWAAAATVEEPNEEGGPPIALVMLVLIMEGKPLVFYFCEAVSSKDTLPVLKAEALRYLKACENTGKLRFAETGGL